MRALALAGAVAVLALPGGGSSQGAACLGDCSGDGLLGIGELIVGVQAVLSGSAPPGCAAWDPDGDGEVTLADVVRGVAAALDGECAVLATPTPAPTPTPRQGCRSDADCAAGGELCLEPGGFAGCGICYGDDELDTEWQRCVADAECAPGVCEPLGPATRTCSACSGAATVCMSGCADDDACEPGGVCRAGRCAPQPCASAADCPDQFDCAAASGGGECRRRGCEVDADCADGFCVENRCHATLGRCALLPS